MKKRMFILIIASNTINPKKKNTLKQRNLIKIIEGDITSIKKTNKYVVDKTSNRSYKVNYISQNEAGIKTDEGWRLNNRMKPFVAVNSITGTTRKGVKIQRMLGGQYS